MFDHLVVLVPLYPVFALTLLYGEWLAAGAVLGRRPIPYVDQPSDIPISGWLHPVTSLALQAVMPMAALTLLLEMSRAASHRSADRLIFRLLGIGALWAALFVFLDSDPGRVLFWFTD